MKCYFDDKEINSLPYKCKHCQNSFCSEHRLPENHNCDIAFTNYIKNKNKYFEKIINDISKSQKKKIQKQKRKESYYKKKYHISTDKVAFEINYNKLIILCFSIILLFIFFKILF